MLIETYHLFVGHWSPSMCSLKQLDGCLAQAGQVVQVNWLRFRIPSNLTEKLKMKFTFFLG